MKRRRQSDEVDGIDCRNDEDCLMRLEATRLQPDRPPEGNSMYTSK